MDSRHVGLRPRKDVVALSEGVLDIPGLFRYQEGADMCEMSVFLRDLDWPQGSTIGGSLSAGFSNCYWFGMLVGLGRD